MKKTLLYLFLMTSSFFYAQTPITEFFSIPMSYYAIVESTPTLDQSSAGANVTWNFNTLTATTDTSLDDYAMPTVAELSTYPGTTDVLTITDSNTNENKIFAKDEAGTISLTGAETPDIELNYSGDNALIGTFPLSYNYNNTDAISGTFSGLASGTFTGTINAFVDAYGTLNTNDVGNGAYSGNVTRLKVVQNINLSAGFITGTVVQTSYYYYDNSTDNIVFRSNSVNISVPIIGLNETTTILESFLGITLSTNTNDFVANSLQVYPNPSSSVINISSNNEILIQAISITDLNGRVVLKKDKGLQSIDVSGLQSGLYVLSVKTEQGVLTKKTVKK